MVTYCMDRSAHSVKIYEDDYEILQQLKEDEGFSSLGEVVRSIMDSFIGYSDDEEDED